MSIVCGTDFSPGAEMAARAAARLARRLDTPMILVHVSDAPGEGGRAGEGSIEKQLRLVADQLAGETGAKIDTRIRAGAADEALAAAARELNAELVVVAARGHADERPRWLTGSTAERVVQISPVPVLVLRQGAWLDRWSSGDLPIRILVALAPGSPVGRGALRWAIRLAARGGCQLQVVHVAWPFGEHSRLGVPAPIPLDHLRPEIAQILQRELETCGRELGAPDDTRYLVTHALGRTEQVIADLAMREGCDLVVLGDHQRAGVARLWQGSVARGVLQSASCSVVCVPLAKDSDALDVRPSYRRVVVSTDFSPLANRALPYAAAMVGSGTLHVVTVVHDLELAEREALRRKLLALVEPLACAHTVEVVSHADVSAGICAAAERSGADAICLATHGRTGVVKLALGSQAQAVVERSRLPVLLVPPPRER